MSRHLTSIEELSSSDLSRIYELACSPFDDETLKGQGVALVYERPSLRTRASSSSAVHELGGFATFFSDEEIGLDSRESAEDVGRTLSQMYAICAMRVRHHEVFERIRKATNDQMSLVNLCLLYTSGPFLDRALVANQGIVVNALSGVSGAGRATSDRLHFSRLAGNAEAYGLLTHRHTIEIQQEIGGEVLFTPHLVPTSRGMLVTAYARVTSAMFGTSDAMKVLRETYADDPCVVVSDEPPTMKDPVGSNLCFVSARVDQRTGWLVAMSSLDNLIKGAAGQAIQAWNVSTDRDEILGLPMSGVTP